MVTNLDEVYSSINSMLENKKYLDYGKKLPKSNLSINFNGLKLLRIIKKF